MSPSIAVIILTYNEARHLPRALSSVASIARSIHVIDSGSTDDTLAIAEAAGAEALCHPFRHQADQLQWAIEHITTEAEWILRLDADEIIEPDLAERIRIELPALSADVAGVVFDRKHIFMDRWIRHGGRYPLTLLRLFRRGKGRVEQRWMDEHIFLEEGRTVHFSGGFADHNLENLSFFIAKHNRYATREATDVLIRRHALEENHEALSAGNFSRQVTLRRQVKERLYNRLPFWIGPFCFFFYRYVFQLGFLDGREGLIYHVLQGFWYRFLIGAKVLELERALKHCATREEKLRELERRTGLLISYSSLKG